jgi:hypothetical protein
MGKSSTETVETRLDPGMEKFRDYVFGQTRALSRSPFAAFTGERVAGMDPATLQGFQQLMAGDPTLQQGLSGLVGGLGGMTGAPDISQFMDPYQQEVIGGIQGDFARSRESALNAVGAQASTARAFGGSRHGIAEGTALGDIARTEASTLAGLRSRGFESATQAALQNRQIMGGLGINAAGILNMLNQQRGQAGIGLGEMRRGINQAGMDVNFAEFMRRVNQPYQNVGLLQNALAGSPYGQTQSTTSTGNALSTLAGIAGFGASFIPGVGPAVDAVSGLFGGGGVGPQQSGIGALG